MSLEGLARIGAEILAHQQPISFAQALEQVERLKKESKVKNSLKKGRADEKKGQ